MTDPSYAELQAEVSNLDVAFESMSRARWTAERERDNAKGYAAEMDAAYTQWRERARKAEARLRDVEAVAAKLYAACDWAITEDLNGVICSRPVGDAPTSRNWCASCKRGWTLMDEAVAEWERIRD